jgi:hypothetical protein
MSAPDDFHPQDGVCFCVDCLDIALQPDPLEPVDECVEFCTWLDADPGDQIVLDQPEVFNYSGHDDIFTLHEPTGVAGEMNIILQPRNSLNEVASSSGFEACEYIDITIRGKFTDT